VLWPHTKTSVFFKKHQENVPTTLKPKYQLLIEMGNFTLTKHKVLIWDYMLHIIAPPLSKNYPLESKTHKPYHSIYIRKAALSSRENFQNIKEAAQIL